MSKRATLILLGLLILLCPFIGLPYSWLMWVLPVLGLWVAYLGYSRKPKAEEPQPVYDAPSA